MKKVPTETDSFYILASISTPYFVRPPHSKVFLRQVLKDGNYFWYLRDANRMSLAFKKMLKKECEK
jgi:hypothetical protein